MLRLTFGDCFNQPIINFIPNSVTHLTFGVHFKQSIKNSIPLTHREIRISISYEREIKLLSICSVNYFDDFDFYNYY